MRTYTQTYKYDQLGNLLQMKSQNVWTRDYVYNFGQNNYLLGHDLETALNNYEYDNHGNMTKMPHLQALKYDYANQLHEVELDLAGNKAYYNYDASGTRVRKTVVKGNITETRYYVGNNEYYTKTTNGTVEVERETLKISDDKQTIAILDTDVLLLATTTRYQLTNHLDSASLELDHEANIISYEEYHPFGTTSYRSGRNEAEVSIKRYKYVFKELDNETGLYYYGMRYYAPWIARFVSVDPLQFKYPIYTPFQYAGNKPISYIDLDGGEEQLAKIIRGAAAIALNNPPLAFGYMNSQLHYMDNESERPYSKGIHIEDVENTDSFKYFNSTDSGEKYINMFKKSGIMEGNILVIRPVKLEKAFYHTKKDGFDKTMTRHTPGDERMGGRAGFTSTGLITRNKEGILISKNLANVTATDVLNSNLKFQFLIVLDGTSYGDAETLGHEALLHSIKYVYGVQKIQNQYKNKELNEQDAQNIAVQLNRLSAERGDYGDFDHYYFAHKQKPAFEFLHFLDELMAVYPTEYKASLKQRIESSVGQY